MSCRPCQRPLPAALQQSPDMPEPGQPSSLLALPSPLPVGTAHLLERRLLLSAGIVWQIETLAPLLLTSLQIYARALRAKRAHALRGLEVAGGALYIELMVNHPRRAPHEDGGPKFWLLFFLGLVIVLILFRAFGAAVEGTSGAARAGGRKRKRTRSGELAGADGARKGARKSEVVHCHTD